MAEINLNPYTAESDAIARRLRMAEALNQQAMQPMELPTQAGVRVSPYAGLAKMLQGYTSGLMQNQALGQQEALSKRYAADTGADFQSLMKALTAPGQAAVQAGAPTYTPNVGAGELADNARMTMQPERNEMGEIIQPGQPGAGNFGITPGAPAQAARLAGQLTPEGFGSMRTPMGQQQYMAQFLTQNVPKEAKWEVKEIKTEGGGTKTVLMNMNSRDPLGTAVEAGKQGPKASYVDIGGTQVPVTGFEPTPQPLVKTLTPGDKQARELSDRAFTQLSANQRAGLQNDAARLGISAQQLYFDTGQSAGGGARLPANVPFVPSATAIPATNVQPPASATLPMTRPTMARPAPVAQAAAPVAGTVSVQAGLTPKNQQQVLLEATQAQAKKERGMAGMGSVIDQARNILSGRSVDAQGNITTAPLPTGSTAGALQDFGASIFGGAPAGSAQADQLKVLGGSLVMSMPRMEGPQSDADVKMYRENAGLVGDNTIPIARRLAALDQVERLYRKYDISSPVAQPFGPRPANAVTPRSP
jgi:hypothetical protein